MHHSFSYKGINMLPQLDYLGVPELAMNLLDIEDSNALGKIKLMEFEGSGEPVKMWTR